jgi:hypothetical protein
MAYDTLFYFTHLPTTLRLLEISSIYLLTKCLQCDEHIEHPLKTKRMSSVNTSSIDGERLLSDEDKEPRLEPM